MGLIDFPERGIARCHPLLTCTSCGIEASQRGVSSSTELLHWAQPCSCKELGASQRLWNQAPGEDTFGWQCLCLEVVEKTNKINGHFSSLTLTMRAGGGGRDEWKVRLPGL